MLQRIHRASQAIELVQLGTITNSWGNKSRKMGYEDRLDVKQSLRTATVKVLREVVKELDLEPSPAPDHYGENRAWKIGNKDELVRRVYLAWEDRFSESTKAAVLAEAKRGAIKRAEAQIEKLHQKIGQLETEVEELESRVH